MKDSELEQVRVPPQDLEAEQSVLGAMLLSPQAILTALGIVKRSDFYRENHKKIFDAIIAMNEKQVNIDVVTIANELRKTKDFESIGGLTALTALLDRVPAVSNVEYYAQIVREKSMARRLIQKLGSVTQTAYDSEKIPEITDELFDYLLRSDDMKRADFDAEMSSLTLDVHTKIQMAKDGTRNPHVLSGFRDFDEKFFGWERGTLTAIMAPPKIGKSHMVINSFHRMAEKYGTKAAYIILDMSRQTVVLRMLSRKLGMTVHEIQSPAVDMEKVANELFQIGKLPVKIIGEEHVGYDLKRIIRWITYARKFYGIEIVFIDSFSKIKIDPERGQTDESYTSNMINAFQSCAKMLDIPIVGMVDLNYEGKAKGSSRWGFGPDNVFKFALSDDGNQLIVESTYLRNSAPGKITLTTNYRWCEVRNYERA